MSDDPSQFAYKPPAPASPSGMSGPAAAAPADASSFAHKAPIAHEVTHKGTGETRRYKTLKSALRAQDRMDNAHGGYITSRRAIYE